MKVEKLFSLLGKKTIFVQEERVGGIKCFFNFHKEWKKNLFQNNNPRVKE